MTHTYGEYETVQRSHDWIARRVAEHGDWEPGRTEAEALGALIIRLQREQEHKARKD